MDSQRQIEAIYRAYPRKVKKPLALKAIKKALRKIGPKILLERVEQYAKHVKTINKEREFIPHPASWFNAESWNDYEDWEELSKSANYLSETAAWLAVRDAASQSGLYLNPVQNHRIRDCVPEPARSVARRIGWMNVLGAKSDFLKLYREAVK